MLQISEAALLLTKNTLCLLFSVNYFLVVSIDTTMPYLCFIQRLLLLNGRDIHSKHNQLNSMRASLSGPAMESGHTRPSPCLLLDIPWPYFMLCAILQANSSFGILITYLNSLIVGGLEFCSESMK